MKFKIRPWFVYACFFTLLGGCLSPNPKPVLITGVNENLPPLMIENQETDLPRHKKPDVTPYSHLEIVGPLPKDEIVRAVNQNRKAFDRCYRDVFQVAHVARQREIEQIYDNDANRRNMDSKSMQPDGMLNSTTFNPPMHGPRVTTDGDVTLHFSVLEDGSVQEARTSLSDLRNYHFYGCLEKVLLGFRFPAQPTSTRVRHLLLRFSHEYGLIRQDKG